MYGYKITEKWVSSGLWGYSRISKTAWITSTHKQGHTLSDYHYRGLPVTITVRIGYSDFSILTATRRKAGGFWWKRSFAENMLLLIEESTLEGNMVGIEQSF